MATKNSTLDIESAHFYNFCKYVPGYRRWCQKTVSSMLEIGLIQVSTAFEHALASVGDFHVISENGCDGSDGSDAKLSTVRHRASMTAYSAYVSNTKGKTGKLRVQVYERIKNKFYYFVIPKKLHDKVTYLEIPFDLDGTPRRSSIRGLNTWWGCEVSSFQELAKT
jgi:hypothetical protein